MLGSIFPIVPWCKYHFIAKMTAFLAPTLVSASLLRVVIEAACAWSAESVPISSFYGASALRWPSGRTFKHPGGRWEGSLVRRCRHLSFHVTSLCFIGHFIPIMVASKLECLAGASQSQGPIFNLMVSFYHSPFAHLPSLHLIRMCSS